MRVTNSWTTMNILPNWWQIGSRLLQVAADLYCSVFFKFNDGATELTDCEENPFLRPSFNVYTSAESVLLNAFQGRCEFGHELQTVWAYTSFWRWDHDPIPPFHYSTIWRFDHHSTSRRFDHDIIRIFDDSATRVFDDSTLPPFD